MSDGAKTGAVVIAAALAAAAWTSSHSNDAEPDVDSSGPCSGGDAPELFSSRPDR